MAKSQIWYENNKKLFRKIPQQMENTQPASMKINYIYIHHNWLVGFYGITFVGYLKPNLFLCK